ncbi:MAG: hypothetical protein ACKOIA_09780 [Acidimicrobiia bacterium]
MTNQSSSEESTVERAGSRRLWLGGAVVLAVAAFIVGIGLLLGAANRSERVESSETKNAALSADGTGLEKLIDLRSSGGSATITDVNLAPGFSVDTMTVSRATDGTVTGSAVVAVGGAGLRLSMDVSFVDQNNWILKAATTNGTSFSPTSGITIDPNSITGAISKSAGTVTWSLTGSTITWNVSTGAVLTTNFSISTTCPFADAQKCPTSAPGTAYIGMPSATLKVAGISNTLVVAGGIDVLGTWARLEGTVGSVAFEGNGISNTQLVLWRGQRADSFDPAMVLPDLSSINNGANFEFCGTFTVSLPNVINKSTNGCARWSSQGIVLAQSGAGTTVVSSVPVTDASGETVAAPASADVKGFAWTNLTNAANFDVAFGGVKTALAEGKWTLAGVASLPGSAANALGIDLKGATSWNFEVRGTFSMTEISISGDIPVKLTIGNEPFKIDVKSVRATIAAGVDTGFTFSIGTTSNVTLGYAPNSREITSSLSLVAATKPSVGMVLSLSAVGKKDTADAGVSGTTIESRLTRPDIATYIWPDQFGIRGLNLFSLSAEIGFTDGSPVVSYTSSSSLNPLGADIGKVLQCNGQCDPSDWMVSSLAIGVSYTNPCFAYGFDGTAGGSTLAIDGGVMKTSVFKLGIAPTGCSIQSGGTTQSLPVGFFGFQFSAAFGSATFDIATQLTADGFVFQTQATNFSLGGVEYPQISLNVTINSSGSQVSFKGQMNAPFGNADVSADFSVKASGISQDLSASVTDWSMGRKGTLEVPQFKFSTSFSIPFDGSCAEISASATGKLVVKSKTYELKEASFRFACRWLDRLVLAIDMEHDKTGGGTAVAEFRLKYGRIGWFSNGLSGGATFEYDRSKSWELYGQTFGRSITIRIEVGFSLIVGNENKADFGFGGSFSADRVSGSLGCEWTSSGKDFRCNGELRLNPSWAGIYYKTWGDL